VRVLTIDVVYISFMDLYRVWIGAISDVLMKGIYGFSESPRSGRRGTTGGHSGDSKVYIFGGCLLVYPISRTL
jgi:hypothetical protein